MNISLKNMRLQKVLTQIQIANLSNISERQYRRIELGEQIPNVYTALLIAQALNTTVEKIFPIAEKNKNI